jgi:hypothetical protein
LSSRAPDSRIKSTLYSSAMVDFDVCSYYKYKEITECPHINPNLLRFFLCISREGSNIWPILKDQLL